MPSSDSPAKKKAARPRAASASAPVAPPVVQKVAPSPEDNPRELSPRLVALRRACLSLPGTDEIVQWGNDLLWRVAEKMFVVVSLEPGVERLSFKCSPEQFEAMLDRENAAPAPYLARYHWIALSSLDACTDEELQGWARASYDLVVAKLPKKLRP